MSKKKAFSGSTMTLKDFHGGSIPSDIPLPSAPGVITRPTDRPGSGLDRHGSWGNPMARPDQRLRPSSSGSMRSFDDKTAFLSNTVHIGRNFDEDERKPLDGSSVPRRTVSDDPVGAPPIRMEPKSAPLSQQVYSSTRVNSASVHGVSNGTPQNAWAARKEVVNVAETAPSSYVGQSNVSRFAHASALDKVSSGRWQTKPVHHQADVEVIRHPESPKGINSITERNHGEKISVRKVEESVQIAGERPKLKLLPRSKPLEAQKILHANDSTQMEISHETVVNDSHVKSRVSGGVEDGKQPVERPKLNLKPRSQPVEQTEETAERVRFALFGGARPRETVLKGRGVEDIVTIQDHVVQSPVRVKKDSNATRTTENANLDQRSVKGINRREQRTEPEKIWRSEKKQPHQERATSPETWRKPPPPPVEPPPSVDGLRFGKAVSAVELAQAFSKQPFSSPTRAQLPFSRLTSGSSSRPQINGY